MANISGIYTALSGMHAQRRVLDVTAHNVANQATEGYHRQRVEMAPAGGAAAAGLFSGPGSRIGGVDVTGVTRIVDTFAENRAMRESAIFGGTAAMSTNLDRIELAFPEPSENGIAAQLDAYWSAWSDVSSNPADPAIRSQLLERASNVIDALGRATADLDNVRDTSAAQIGTLAEEANDLATRIAKLNNAIVGSETPNDLLDQRDLLVKQLSALTGATARPAANGAVDVTIGGRAIVSGPRAELVDGSTGSFVWASDGSAVRTPPSQMASLTATIEKVVPRYQAELDAVAESLVTQVNALHSTGYDPAGNTGLNFFDPANITARNISLSVDIDGLPNSIAAGAPVFPGPVAPGANDGDMARQLAALAEAASGPGTIYQSMVTTLGIETRGARQQNTVQSQVSLAADTRAESVGGVSIDEEMANLVASQRAYEASARVLTAVDEMMGVLLRTGTVGR